MTASERIEAIADNRFVTGLSRLSMAITPLLFAALLGVSWYWLAGALQTQRDATAEVSERVDDLADLSSTIVNRVVTLEVGSARGRADRERFQDEMALRMRSVESGLSALAANIAALDATIRTMRDRQALNIPTARP